MLSLLLADFITEYGMLILLGGSLLLLFFLMVNRRRKETEYRETLSNKIVVGTKVKTYSGIYGKVVSIEETTDGKIVLLQTGDEKHVSYVSLHINAIYAMDEKTNVILDKDGNPVLPELPDLDQLEKERMAEKEAKEAEVKEEKPAPKAEPKKTATKKAPASGAKKTTTKK